MGEKTDPMRALPSVLFVVCVLYTTSCSTGYHSNGFSGGYSETVLAPDVYRIVFRGNGYTSAERTQDFAMLRAAEITCNRHYTCFAIIDQNQTANVSSYTTPGYASTTATATGSSYGNMYYRPGGATYYGNSSATVNAHTFYPPPRKPTKFTDRSPASWCEHLLKSLPTFSLSMPLSCSSPSKKSTTSNENRPNQHPF